MKILHIISGLDTGGAEMMLFKVLRGLGTIAGFECEVISLRRGGALAARIEGLGVRVHRIEMGEPLRAPFRILRMAAIVRRFGPDIIQGWMYHGNLFSTLIRTLSMSPARVLWNVRQTLYSLDREKPMTAWVIRICARVSSTPTLVLYNSSLSSQQHGAVGFDRSKSVLVPNGFDLRAFRPLTALERRDARARLGIPDGCFTVGTIGRYHPMKDHVNFIAAAGRFFRDRPEAFFVMAGKGLTLENQTVMDAIATAGLGRNVLLLGEREDIPTLCGSLDVFVLASAYGEGFPNALGEAMACGIACASTDVGDCASILGESGRIVPPRDPEALARALSELHGIGHAGRFELGAKARSRIQSRYSVESVVARYAEIYRTGSGADTCAG